MTKSRYGLLASVAGVGAALATWFWRRQDYVARKMSEAGRGHSIGDNQ